jgi:hypothetical protein
MATKPTGNPEGRPTDYNVDIADRICDLVSSSHFGLAKICKLNPDIPGESTIRRWASQIPEFREKYNEAYEKQAPLLFEGAISEMESLEDCTFINQTTGATDISSSMVAFKKALSDRKARHAAILSKRFRIPKDEDPDNKDETFSKLKPMVDDLNKTNSSEV